MFHHQHFDAMKKLLLPLILLLTVSLSFGQITITRDDMPSIGDTIRVSSGTTTSVDPALTGPGFTWDFSDLIPTSQRVVSFVNINTTPFFYQIVFNQNVANLASPASGLDFLSQFQFTDAYEYFKATATNYVRPGYAVTISGVPVPMKFNQAELLYNFPLSITSPVDSSLSTYSIQFPGLGYFGIERKRVNEVDGWGSLTTPMGTFDVLRVKSTLFEADSLYLDSLQMGVPIIRDIIEYQWIAKNMSIPVLTISVEGGINTITYIDRIENFNPLVVDLGPDMDVCQGEEIELLATVSGGTPPYTYTWSTGETTEKIMVSPEATTNYVVAVADAEMRFMMDDITLNVIEFPRIDLGADTMICAGTSLTFSAPVDYDELSWWVNGLVVSEASTFTIDSTGIGLSTVHVRVEYSLGQCTASDEMMIGFQLCNGLGEMEVETALIYPNPARENLGIKLDWTDGELMFTLYTVEGKEMRSGRLNLRNKVAEIKISDLISGNYFLVFQQGKKLASAKFIKE